MKFWEGEKYIFYYFEFNNLINQIPFELLKDEK